MLRMRIWGAPPETVDCADLGDGLQVVAMGSVMVYEPRSQYQFGIKKIIPIRDGISSLKLKRLREKLDGEGLFSQDRKKPIPCLPSKVGIITSKNSAAIRDILTVEAFPLPPATAIPCISGAKAIFGAPVVTVVVPDECQSNPRA